MEGGAPVKLLQVTNLAQIVGGTLACAWTITRALPDWEHHVVAVNSGDGEPPPETTAAFGQIPVERRTHLKPDVLQRIAPDVILFHNTSEHRMPNWLPDCLLLYYQHSGVKNCIGARNRCHYWWACSQHLANVLNCKADVLLQPCPVPPVITDHKRTTFPDETRRIGRLCTPHPNKWRDDDLLPLYRRLSQQHEAVEWHFVGCPVQTRERLAAACSGRAVFHEAGWQQRSLLRSWNAMLYSSASHESYGRVVCEAQRAGCIPIVSRHSGFVEQIHNGGDGYLCQTADDFSHAVQFVLKQEIAADVSVAAVAGGNARGSLELWRKRFLGYCRAIVDEIAA